MKRILYLECNSGISGDMTVGALLDLGADRGVLEHALESLHVDGYHLHFGRTVKSGIDAFDFDVHLETDCHDEGHSHEHEHEHGHGHSHKHEHEHSHKHGHEHRNLYDIYEIISRLDSSERVKSMARRMFEIVAEAEAKAHGLPIDEVHFHEVGAIDSIVDIISTAVCVDNLGVDEIVISPLAEGRGYVECQHGTLPVPVPATANIAAAHGLTLRLTENNGEMVTPTGAAIAAALRSREELPTACKIKSIGIGAGKREYNQANILRAMILEDEEKTEDAMWVLETNLDDCTGENLGFAMECLLEAGAADVWYQPVYMKKNRPAYQLSLLCKQSEIGVMEAVIFSQTTTIGIRRYQVERSVLPREVRTIRTGFGPVHVKTCRYQQQTYHYPEYEEIRKICKEQNLDFKSVYYQIQKEAQDQ